MVLVRQEKLVERFCFHLRKLELELVVNRGAVVLFCGCVSSETQTDMTANDPIASLLFSISTEQPRNGLNSMYELKYFSRQSSQQRK